VRVKHDAPVPIGEIERRNENDPQRSIEHGRPDHHPGEGRASVGRIHLTREHDTAERVHSCAREPQQVRRAPERHIDPEEPVPQIVDRCGEHRERDAPRGQMRAPCSDESQYPHHRRRDGTRPVSGRLHGEEPKAQEHHEADARVRHDVRRDPERVAADLKVPLDVPAQAPGAEHLGGEHRPENAAGQRRRRDAPRRAYTSSARRYRAQGRHRSSPQRSPPRGDSSVRRID
jgi:hypothetical protein